MSVFPVSVRTPDFRRADRIRGLVIVGATFVVCLLISVWAKRRAKPEVSMPPAPPTSAGVVGFPKAVDVLKTLPAARALTRRNLLRGISIEGVTAGGLVDVSSIARVRYSFQSAPGEGPQPAREPGTLARRPYCGRQDVEVSKSGMVASADSPDASCAPHPSDPLPEPRCSPADIWSYATAHGANTRYSAHIEYYRASAGPAWRFEEAKGGPRFSLYGDCKRQLDGRDAANVAP